MTLEKIKTAIATEKVYDTATQTVEVVKPTTIEKEKNVYKTATETEKVVQPTTIEKVKTETITATEKVYKPVTYSEVETKAVTITSVEVLTKTIPLGQYIPIMACGFR